MNSFEINKIITAILVTILVVFGISKISNIIFDKDDKNVVAYKVETTEETSKEVNASETNVDLNALLAMGDIDHGKKVFKKCAACHSINKGGSNKIGPNLWNILGKQSGSVANYKYSKAMTAHQKSWTFEEMNGFLISPKKWIKGTKMSFIGLSKPEDRAAVILYMNKNTDSPLPIQ